MAQWHTHKHRVGTGEAGLLPGGVAGQGNWEKGGPPLTVSERVQPLRRDDHLPAPGTVLVLPVGDRRPPPIGEGVIVLLRLANTPIKALEKEIIRKHRENGLHLLNEHLLSVWECPT